MLWKRFYLKMIKTEKFKIIELVKNMINDIDDYIVNFPNKELELKRRLKDTAYDLLLVTYEANVTTNLMKKLALEEKAVALIKFFDFLINRCYEKQIINSKKYFRFGESLDNVVKYFAGWMNSTKTEIGKLPT